MVEVLAHENLREIASFLARYRLWSRTSGWRSHKTHRQNRFTVYVCIYERMDGGRRPKHGESDAVRRASCEIYAYNRAIIRFKVHLTISTYE